MLEFAFFTEALRLKDVSLEASDNLPDPDVITGKTTDTVTVGQVTG